MDELLQRFGQLRAMTLPPLYSYAFYYPFVMAWVWMSGGVVHALMYERAATRRIDPLAQYPDWPMVSIVVPCFNEGPHLRSVVAQLLQTRYPDFTVILVDDGSTDDTAEIIDELCEQHPQLRAVHHELNQGKAVGLNTATVLARGEYVLGIGGDALTDPNAAA